MTHSLPRAYAVYGEKRDYPKIEIFVYQPRSKTWAYVATTTWARTCREALEHWSGPRPARANFQATRLRAGKGR